MRLSGDYGGLGYAYAEGLVPPEACAAILRQTSGDLARAGKRLEDLASASPLLAKEAVQLYGYHYPPLLMLLWGLTPAMSMIAGADLVPTYNYLRIYRGGDICRVHADRASCEYSLSLTLAYADDLPWSLDVAEEETEALSGSVEEGFNGPFRSFPMAVGDAVAYQGLTRRHGRTSPNPNRWSAHVFCHWVDRDGPHAESAFDGNRHRFDRVDLSWP